MTQYNVAPVIAYAQAQLGKPYKWGGAGPDSYDCSGLTMMAYRQIKIGLPHLAAAQMRMGKSVAFTDMLPGDLCFPGPEHVQMYIGNGQVIEAPHTGANVRQVPFNSSYITTVRRMVPGDPIVGSPADTPVHGPLTSDTFGVVQGADNLAGAIGALSTAIGFIIDPHNWWRIGLFVLGMGFVFVAMYRFAKPQAQAVAKGLVLSG